MKFAQLLVNCESLISPHTVDSMKPHEAIQADPQDIPTEALAVMTPTLEEESEGVEGKEFPDTYVPDTIQGLIRTNESIDYHTQLTDKNITLLNETIDQVGEIEQMSPLVVRSISTQLSNIQDTLGEDTSSVQKYLDSVLTSDGPYNKQVTMENLQKVSLSLKPLLLRSLSIPINTHKKLMAIDEKITPQSLDTAIKSIERSKRIGVNDESPIDASIDIATIFPKIVEAVDKGYDIDDIKSHVMQTTKIDSGLSTVAVTAIVNALRKIQLQTSRYISSRDLATVKRFLEKAVAVQELESSLLSSIAGGLGGEVTGNDSGINLTNSISSAVSEFFKGCVKLADNSPSTMTDSDPSYIYNIFTSGKVVVLSSDGSSMSPVTYGQSSYAMFQPSQIHDIYDAYVSVLTPLVNKLKQLNQTNAQAATAIVNKVNDPNNKDTANDSVVMESLAACMSKCSKALKFSSLMALSGMSFCEDIEYCIREMCRGMAIIAES